MSAAEAQITETENERVERWRTETLERVGYDAESAHELAIRTDIDLHRAIKLIEEGCSPEVALRILL